MKWHNRIIRPVEDNRRDWPLGLVFPPRQHVGPSHPANRRNPLGKLAGQHKSHPSAVGQSIGVNSVVVNLVFLFQLIDQVGNKLHILAAKPVTRSPTKGETTATWIHDQKTEFVRQLVPMTESHHMGRPLRKPMEA